MTAQSGFARKAREGLDGAWFKLSEAFLKLWAKLGGWIDRRFGDEEFVTDREMAQGFKPDAVAIEEAPVPVSANAALYVVLSLLAIAIVWSIVGTLDRIVVAQGKVATRTPLIVMQPFTTSRIMQINVLPGDHVTKGQILVSFDPAFAQADVSALQHKVNNLTAEVERLGAQLNGGTFAAASTESSERKTQAEIFSHEMASYQAELAQRDSRLSATQSQFKAANETVAGLQQQLAMSQKVVDIYQKLLDQKAGAPLDLMKAQSAMVDVNTRLMSAIGESKRLAQQRAETLAERQSYIDKWRSDHNERLVQARSDLADSTESLTKAQRLKEFTQMKAPASGTVLEIADRSVGSVLREAETLITIVPDGADLYVEANVPSRDISYLKVGNDVRVKFESYPFQKYGTLNGRLEVLSADSVPLKENDQSSLVYRAQVRLIDPPADIVRRGIKIRPGLVSSAEIKTGKRSIASYILNPILRTADEGMREP